MSGKNWEYHHGLKYLRALNSYGLGEVLEDGVRAAHGPITEWFSCQLRWVHKNSGIRGPGLYENQLDRFIVGAKWATFTEGGFMNVIEALKDNYEKAAELWESYKDRLKAFRSDVKNDVQSLEAASRKTTEAVQRMNKAYSDVLAQLNGGEMARAIENAERLAKALGALAELQSHKLVFAVTDQNETSGGSQR